MTSDKESIKMKIDSLQNEIKKLQGMLYEENNDKNSEKQGMQNKFEKLQNIWNNEFKQINLETQNIDNMIETQWKM